MSDFHILPPEEGDKHYTLKILRPGEEITHGTYLDVDLAIVEAREMGREEAEAKHPVDIEVFDKDGNVRHVPLWDGGE